MKLFLGKNFSNMIFFEDNMITLYEFEFVMV